MRLIQACLLMAIASLARGDESVVDAKLASNAEVVLRVRLLDEGESNKYQWNKVEVLRVLKNASHDKIPHTLEVAAYSWKEGVPSGESTIYLEQYHETKRGLWKLVGGDAVTGVSHVKKP
ncbi:MAG TPA: hypothetical protein VLE43_05825 [Candidatus Saccharimonadia bacterium]|nr:hypothetical protein [Candidatus Saccharimonadia bacterium]